MSAQEPETPVDVFRFKNSHPSFGERIYIDTRAHVSGAVALGDDVSVWPMAVVRGDVNSISIGDRSNVQDGCVLHVSHEGPLFPHGSCLEVGTDVTIGHAAVLHGCTIGNRCLIGMGAVVLDGARVEDQVMIAAGSVVTPGTEIPAGTLWRGNPARYARDLKEREVQLLQYSAAHYVRLKDAYLAEPAHERPLG